MQRPTRGSKPILSAHMARAIAEAQKGLGRTRPNPVVGCVIARGEHVLAVGHHKRAGLAHAEIVALRRAGAQARGADVYVTLEPCNHTGRTGPCAQALIEAQVGRVIIGSRDPHSIVAGRGIKRLRQAGIEVHTGLLKHECATVNEAYLHAIVHKRPFVVAKIAQSLDGRVATRTGHSKWITGEAARASGHRLRNHLDAIVVGVGTVLADNPSLTCRIRGGRDPHRFVLDTNALTPPDAAVVQCAKSSSAPTVIVVGPDASAQRCAQLERQGAQIIQVPLLHGHVSLVQTLQAVYRMQLLSVLIEGGPTLMGAFFDAGLVNKVEIFTAPIIIGGGGAKSSVLGQGIDSLDAATRLHLMSITPLGQDWHIVGYPQAAKLT